MMMQQFKTRRLARLGAAVLAACMLATQYAQAEGPRINLQNTEVRALVETVSKLTGKNFVIDPSVRGTITFVSGKGLSEEEFYEAFLSILQVHGLEAIEAGNIIKIVPIGKARATVAPIIQSGPGAAQTKIDVDETITQVFKLQYIPVSTAIQTLTPLAGQGETRIQFNQSSNAVIVTGRGQNVQRLAEVIKSIDQPNNNDFEMVPLKHSIATQLVQTLRELMTNGGVGPEGVQMPQQVRIAADDRTNSILLAGPKAERETIIVAIKRLDVPRSQPSETQVVALKYAIASKLIQTLKELQVTPAISGGAASGDAASAAVPVNRQVRIAADERTNSILLSGPRNEREQIVTAIRRLDIPKASSGGTKVVPLRYSKAEEMVKVLNDASKGIVQQSAGTAAAAGVAPAGTAAAGASGGGVGGAELSILADKTTNSIILTGPAYAQRDVLKVIYQLDRRRAQVLVEAIIAEVSTDLTSRLGFGVGALNGGNGSTGLVGSSNFGSLTTALQLSQGNLTSLPNGLLMGIAGSNFALIADALKGDGATNILSTPTIVTMDNEEAKMVVGQNVPFVTGQTTSGSNSTTNPFTTIERKDVGLSLTVTPQINRGRTIQMKIEQEVSSLSQSAVAGASDLVTNKRSLNTNVMVEDGQVLVLGGLIQDNFNNSESKVPILSDLPVIGGAFKQNSSQKTKQNLMVFIHPVILPDREAADAYTRSKYHTLQKQQQQSRVLQRGNAVGAAAVFPDIECIDGACGSGSADELHFPARQPPARPISQQQRQQQAQQQQQQQRQQQAQQKANQGAGLWQGKREPGAADCVPGFCQLQE